MIIGLLLCVVYGQLAENVVPHKGHLTTIAAVFTPYVLHPGQYFLVGFVLACMTLRCLIACLA